MGSWFGCMILQGAWLNAIYSDCVFKQYWCPLFIFHRVQKRTHKTFGRTLPQSFTQSVTRTVFRHFVCTAPPWRITYLDCTSIQPQICERLSTETQSKTRVFHLFSCKSTKRKELHLIYYRENKTPSRNRCSRDARPLQIIPEFSFSSKETWRSEIDHALRKWSRWTEYVGHYLVKKQAAFQWSINQLWFVRDTVFPLQKATLLRFDGRRIRQYVERT